MTPEKNHRIVQLTADNVKRLKAVTIKPDGNLVIIGGRNNQGKSSILESIMMAIGGADMKLTKPVRAGTDKASIVLDLGDIVVKRTFTAAGGTTLVVENADGAKYPSPQTILNQLTNRLTFDPFAFTRLDPAQQKAALQKLLNIDFSKEEAEYAELFAKRTNVNREVVDLRGQVKGMPEHKDVPAEEERTALLLEEITKAGDHNSRRNGLKITVDAKEKAVSQMLATTKSLGDAVAELELKLAAAKESLTKRMAEQAAEAAELKRLRDEHDNFKVIDVAPLTTRLTEAEATNAKVRANAARAAKIAEGQKKVSEAAELTAKLEKILADRTTKLSATKFPVPGLSLGDAGVLFNDLPLDQAGTADQIRVSVAIAAALNPKLRVMLIKDGSLMDQDSLRLLAELAAEHDLQVWIERVGKDANASVVIEDGEVSETPAAQPKEET